MIYVPKEFKSLKGKGFSDELLEMHFALYEKCVKNTNELLDDLYWRRDKRINALARAELRRRLGWAWNGMRLHELYFEGLGGTGELDQATELHGKLETEFGSFNRFAKDYREIAEIPGVHWVVLYYDPLGNHLFNGWFGGHDCAHPAGASPLLIMDVCEHAFFIDHGTRKDEYVDAFFANVDWSTVCLRFLTGLENRALSMDSGPRNAQRS